MDLFIFGSLSDSLLILSCLVFLPLYYRVRRFNSLTGVALVLLFLGQVALRFLTSVSPFINPFALNLMPRFVGSTLLFTLVAIVLIFGFSGYRRQSFRSMSYLVKIAILYMVFAIIEQLFFNFVVTQTLYKLTEHLGVTVLLAGIFFCLFHVQLKKRDRGFFMLGSFLMGIFYAWLYVSTESIVLPSISMAIIAATYYSVLCEVDVLKFRFGDKS